MKGYWKTYELIWLLTFSAIAVSLSIVWKDNWFGFSVFLSGVLCVVLAAKGSIYTYIFGTYNTFTYAFLAYNNGLFGEVGLYLLFFAPMNIIGFAMWRNKISNGIVLMRRLGIQKFLLILLATVMAATLLGYGLSHIKVQNTPYIDAMTTTFSITATFLMVARYSEQWLMYILLNIFTVVMWIYRLTNGSADAAIMIVMWTAFLINAVIGYYNWTLGAKYEK